MNKTQQWILAEKELARQATRAKIKVTLMFVGLGLFWWWAMVGLSKIEPFVNNWFGIGG